MLKVNSLLIMEMIQKIWDSVTNLSEVVLGVELGELMEMNILSIDFTELSESSNIIDKASNMHQPIGMLMITMLSAMVAMIEEELIAGVHLITLGDGVEIGMEIGMDVDIITNISDMPGMKLQEFNIITISGEDTTITVKSF